MKTNFHPMRKCIGCLTMQPKEQMLRIVKSPDKEFFLDQTQKSAGRGAYICNNKACIEKALKTKGLERSFKCRIPSDFLESITEDLNR